MTTAVQENKKLIAHLKECYEKVNEVNHLTSKLLMKTVCKIYFFKK